MDTIISFEMWVVSDVILYFQQNLQHLNNFFYSKSKAERKKSKARKRVVGVCERFRVRNP